MKTQIEPIKTVDVNGGTYRKEKYTTDEGEFFHYYHIIGKLMGLLPMSHFISSCKRNGCPEITEAAIDNS